MFSYYGGKGRIALHYPAPIFPLVIEPFAGGGWYSIKWIEKLGKGTFNSILCDVDPIIVETWRWLIQEATEMDIDDLPEYIPKTPMIRQTPTGKDFFYRWWGNHGSNKPKNYAGSFCKMSKSKTKFRIPLIKNWHIIHGPYSCLKNIEATWFIDPPYQSESKGSLYRFNKIDYDDLRNFCLSRRGQIIVCDREGADWLPFRPLEHKTRQGQRNQKLKEVIYEHYC